MRIRSSVGIELVSGEVKQVGIKGLTFEWRPFSIPGLLQWIELLLFFCCWQTHLFPFLLIHYLPDCSLGLIVELLQRFSIVDLGCINLRVSFEDSPPYLLFSFFQVEVHKYSAACFFYLPEWLRSVYFFNDFSLNHQLASFPANWYEIWFKLHFYLNKCNHTSFAVIDGSISIVT